MESEGIETEVDHAGRHAICEKSRVSISVRVAPSGELKDRTHAPVFDFGVRATEYEGDKSGDYHNAGKYLNSRSET